MSDIKKVLELSVMAGEILLRNGAEIFRVQDTMTIIVDSFEKANFNVYVISNGIFASISKGNENHYTEIKHIPLSPVHLGRVEAVNNLSREIAQGKLNIDEAINELHRISKIPYSSDKLQILCSGIGSACFCYIFGGTAFDSGVSFISGIILYIFITFIGKRKVSKIMVNILGSSLVTLCGCILFSFNIGNNLDKIIIGSIIPLVPGVPITTSIRDFLNGDYLSGTIRLIDALLIAFCIAIGVGIILKFYNLIGGVLLWC